MKFLLFSAMTLVSAAMTAAEADEAPSEPRPPMVDGKPVEVAIGFYALDFARVTSRDESFDITGYLEMSWRDPGLARSSAGPQDRAAGSP